MKALLVKKGMPVVVRRKAFGIKAVTTGEKRFSEDTGEFQIGVRFTTVDDPDKYPAKFVNVSDIELAPSSYYIYILCGRRSDQVQLEVREWDTIESIKREMLDDYGWNCSKHIFYEKMELQDKKTLRDYNIKSRDDVYCGCDRQ